jgi:transaldolase
VTAVGRLKDIAARGQSIWFDDLGRSLIRTGELERLVREHSVTGVTTNPTILARALMGSSSYDDQLTALANEGLPLKEIYARLVAIDIQEACDVLHPVWVATGGSDGFVSVEVSPAVSLDVDATVAEVRSWFKRIDRDNLFVKVPATEAGNAAFEQLTSEGVSINVTLIFSLDRYRRIAESYISGLERFLASGGDVSKVHSVASFFVSRIDTEVDARLAKMSEDVRIERFEGKVGIANARVAYGVFEDLFSSDRWYRMAERGANVQRPLWASTGVKDPAYPDTMYVDSLVAPRTVNTMPLATLQAVADHGSDHTGFSDADIHAARDLLAALPGAGIDYDDVTAVVEREGLDKFAASFDELLPQLDAKIRSSR